VISMSGLENTKELLRIKSELEKRLRNKKGVEGIGLSNDRIIICVSDESVIEKLNLFIPKSENVPIEVMVTGKFKALSFFQEVGKRGEE